MCSAVNLFSGQNEMESILVTAVGGGVGQSILKSLQHTSYRVVGADSEPLGTGLYAVQRGYLVPYARESSYIDRLLEVCRREQCSLLFPGLDAELLALAPAVDSFRAIGVTPVVSSAEVVGIADDKLLTSRFLKAHGFAAPETDVLSESAARAIGLPLVIKPRKLGQRSQGVHVVRDPRDLGILLETLSWDSYVVQQYLEGDEYTAGTVSFEGRCMGSIVMRRILRDGDTHKAFVYKDPFLARYVMDVATALRPFGACNFQFRIKDRKPFIFEINARCSGTTYSRTLAGFNEPQMIADYLLRGRDPVCEIRELTIIRYWKEIAVENSRVDRLTRDLEIDGDGTCL